MIETNSRVEIVPKDNNQLLLKVEIPTNEIGIIYRLSGILFVHDLNIITASVVTSKDGIVKDEFLLQSKAGSTPNLNQLNQDIDTLMGQQTSMFDYLAKYPEKIETLKKFQSVDKTEIDYELSGDTALIKVSTVDRAGLLFDISQVLFLYTFDIIDIQTESDGQMVTDRIKVKAENKSLLSMQSLNKLKAALLKEV